MRLWRYELPTSAVGGLVNIVISSNQISAVVTLSPLARAQEDVAAEHKAEASADWSEQEGISRVDYKTKEQLNLWYYQVLKNWAYSQKVPQLCVESMEFL